MGYIVEFGLSIGANIPTGVFVIGSSTQGLIGTNTLGTSTTLADYSDRIQMVNTQRTSDRTSGPLVSYNAGTATVRLLNMDGALDPYVLEQAGLTTPGVVMRVRYQATDGTIYPVFWGYVDSWDPVAESPLVGMVTVTATDGFVRLNQKLGELVSPVGANESVYGRVVRVLDAMGYPTDLRSLGSTSEIVQATSFNEYGLALIQEAVRAEVGEFYQQPDGVMYLRGWQAIVNDTRSATSQATFGSNRAGGEIPYVGRPLTSWNKSGMHNRVVAQIDGSENPQVAEDAAAVSLYGTEYTLTETALKLTTDAAALSWAAYVLANDVKPTFQFSGITLNSALEQTGVVLATTTITDTFTRADSTTTLGSTESPVLAWTANVGTWGISTNRAYQVSPSTVVVDYATLDSGYTEHSFEAKITSLATDRYPGVVTRYVDANNMYQARVEGSTGVVKTYRFQAGVVTQLGTTFAFADGDKLKIETLEEPTGTRVNVYKNGTLQINPLDTAGSRPTTGTKFGITYAILNAATGSSFFDDVTAAYTTTVAAPSTIAQQFGRKLGDRVTVVRRPPAAPYGSIVDSRQLYVQGISHAWDVKTKQTLTTFDLTPISTFPTFLIGSATLGLIGTNTLGRGAGTVPLTIAGPTGSPAITTVSDGTGVLAKLTTGAKTVLMRGPSRALSENKKPIKDDFSRTTTNGFGASPGGGTWSNTTGQDAMYSTGGASANILMDTANSSRYASIIDDAADVNVVTRWTMDEVPVGAAASLGLVIGYADPNNNYRARLSVATTGIVQLILEKEVAGTVTTLGALTQVGTGWVANQWWLIRIQRTGSNIRCRAWLDGTTEPSTWLHDVDDSSLGAGRVGLRGLASTGNTNIPFNMVIDYVDIQSCTWAAPVTVTHGWWVRVLPTAYSGTWTTTIEDQIRAWVGSTSPDVLAYAQRYQTGGVNQAGYGPMNTDGTLQEGSDFHEYLGVPWTFPNGESMPYAGPEWVGKLDCSGFVRMVYGYHMGIPMVMSLNFNGTNLPRTSVNISGSGPGVMVADGGAGVPSLTNLQIGDVVSFDAELADGIIDHDGIYVGTDPNGFLRFVSSRKTPNGPTFGDLGGNSRLDGGGTYATTLRTIRRF